MRSPIVVVSLCLLAATSGCDQSTTGGLGRLEFTPEHCGIPFGIGCSFDRHLTAGATVEIYVEAKEGFSSAGLELTPATPALLSVETIPDLDGRPAWRLEGLAPGRAEIAAVDRDGAEVDFLRFEVRAPEYRLFQADGGSASRDAMTADGFDESWRIRETVDLSVRPYTEAGDQMMGILSLRTDLSTSWMEVENKGDFEQGEIELYRRLGFSQTLEATFIDPLGVEFSVQLHP